MTVYMYSVRSTHPNMYFVYTYENSLAVAVLHVIYLTLFDLHQFMPDYR